MTAKKDSKILIYPLLLSQCDGQYDGWKRGNIDVSGLYVIKSVYEQSFFMFIAEVVYHPLEGDANVLFLNKRGADGVWRFLGSEICGVQDFPANVHLLRGDFPEYFWQWKRITGELP